MSSIIVTLIGLAFAVASLFLTSVGLAIIFGMMRVINFAHGEFLMLGGYAFILSVHAGVNPWVAMLVIAPVSVGLLGVVVERLIIRRLYGRLVDTILATWGLSLVLTGIASVVFGYNQPGIAPLLSDFRIGEYSVAGYNIFIIVVAIVLLAGLFAVFRFTNFGLKLRATMQNPSMAAAVGLNVNHVYMATFGLGSALAGLAGAVIAPLTGVQPVMGATYIGKTFITVISGGPLALTGTFFSSSLLGLISEITTVFSTPVIGEAALLAVAVVMLRILPAGITGRYFKRGV
ncbi:branched-chain amino acid ABC transporter permease [Falsochrobactrum shanghaiense]|uniref:Branched-chain amino acid ABC transporter permease n=1 Tax=Falsochrobactrum shanghaiense TaxID=2201899 RepID=A0A316J312_9HYPH|nr:branched-chain amino acid ABC transporter permease [Falsochrobactrum shanghaiense]PWL16302.1 branched-chain amino acid ABC transporter permease [Falsochrobactrum shanghaiense]